MKSLASLLLLACACATEPEAPDGDPVTSSVEYRAYPMSMNTRLDLLFVIDNSPAMAAAQAKVAGDVRLLVESLARIPGSGDYADVQVGVVSTDLADPAELRGGDFLAVATRFNWQIESSFDPATPIGTVLAPRADVGAAGSADTRPLEAMRRALAGSPGFVRDDAYLAIVFVTAGDDRGTHDVAQIAGALKALKDDPTRVMILGELGACSDGTITATAAPRLEAFLDQFPNRAAAQPLCATDLAPLTELARPFRTTLGLACMENLRMPLDCASWLAEPTTDEQVVLPMCSSPDQTRCFTLEPHPGCVAIEQNAVAILSRPRLVPFDAVAHVQCVSQ